MPEPPLIIVVAMAFVSAVEFLDKYHLRRCRYPFETARISGVVAVRTVLGLSKPAITLTYGGTHCLE